MRRGKQTGAAAVAAQAVLQRGGYAAMGAADASPLTGQTATTKKNKRKISDAELPEKKGGKKQEMKKKKRENPQVAEAALAKESDKDGELKDKAKASERTKLSEKSKDYQQQSGSEEEFSSEGKEEEAYWRTMGGDFDEEDSDFADGDFGYSSDDASQDGEEGLKDEYVLQDEMGQDALKDGNEGEGREAETLQPSEPAKLKSAAKFAEAFGKILEASKSDTVAEAKDPILTNFRVPGKDKTLEKEKKKKKELREMVLKKRMLANKDHFMPEHLHTPEDRVMRKLATRGVVALFNAVRKQQKLLPEMKEQTKAQNPQKVEKLSKQKFIELLQQSETSAGLKQGSKLGKPGVSEQAAPSPLLGQAESTKQKQPNWEVLRDDFMMGAKLRDFDKAPPGNSKKKK